MSFKVSNFLICLNVMGNLMPAKFRTNADTRIPVPHVFEPGVERQ